MKIKSILFVIAMEAEAEPILKAFNVRGPRMTIEPPLPPIAYETEFSGLRLHFVVNGQDPMYKLDSFGTDAATLSTYLGIRKFAPDLVISTGVAGGFKSRAQIGDVYLSQDSMCYFDRRVSITSPNYQDYAIGFYPVIDASKMAKALKLKTGIVVTGGSFENSLIDDRQIRNLNGSAVEMEATAVGKMSMLLKKHFMAVRSIVDFDDAIGFASQFDQNFKIATKSLGKELPRIVEYLSKHPIGK